MSDSSEGCDEKQISIKDWGEEQELQFYIG